MKVAAKAKLSCLPQVPFPSIGGKAPTQRKKRLYSGMQAKRQSGIDIATESALTGAIASALTSLSYERPAGTIGRNRPVSRGNNYLQNYKVVGSDDERSAPSTPPTEVTEAAEPLSPSIVPRSPSDSLTTADTSSRSQDSLEPPAKQQTLAAARPSVQGPQAVHAVQLMAMHPHAHPGFVAHHPNGMPMQYPMHPNALPMPQGHFMAANIPGNMAPAGYPHMVGYSPLQMYAMPPSSQYPRGFMMAPGQFPMMTAMPYPVQQEGRSAPLSAQNTAATSSTAVSAPAVAVAANESAKAQVSRPDQATLQQVPKNTHISAVQAQAQAQAQQAQGSQRPAHPRAHVVGTGALKAGANSANGTASAGSGAGPVCVPSGQLPAQYWAGVLYYDAIRCVQVWRGSWVNLALGQAGQRPSPELLARSASQFEYTSEVVQRSVALTPEGALLPQAGFLRGTYRMISELTGKFETFTDREFFIEYEPTEPGANPRKYAVYGSGDCQFGAFVVTGSFNTLSSVMELTRQYISV